MLLLSHLLTGVASVALGNQYDSSSTSEATMKNMGKYCKTSSISRTKSQLHLTVSHVVLQLSLPNSLKPGVKSRMKM